MGGVAASFSPRTGDGPAIAMARNRTERRARGGMPKRIPQWTLIPMKIKDLREMEAFWAGSAK
jgi:hypothetical protein